MSEIKRQLAAANLGKMARIILDHLDPVLVSMKAETLEKIKNAYLLGDKSETLFAYAAELATLDNIKNKLEQQFKRAERISAERNVIDAD